MPYSSRVNAANAACATPEVNAARCNLARLSRASVGASPEEIAAARAALDAAMWFSRAQKMISKALPAIGEDQRERLADMLGGRANP
jgi:hypothetical protein